MNYNTQMIVQMSDGNTSSKEIAEALGITRRYVSKTQKKMGLPQLKQGAQRGQNNPAYISGRRCCLDGYVTVSAPDDHPYSKIRKGRNVGSIYEHRLVMEKKIGRYLRPEEVVDHIDGLTLHNDPQNLRLFESNAEHLRQTISGKKKNWSEEGKKNIGTRSDLGISYQPVDTHYENRKCGDVRLLQILRASLKLGIDSPHLSGTLHHLEKIGIDYSSRSNLKHALAQLSQKLGLDH